MADAPFDRSNIGYLSKPISDDHNRQASQNARTMAYLVAQLLGGRATHQSQALALRDIFHGNGFAVVASNPAALNVRVTAGLGWHYLPADLASSVGAPDLIGVDDLAELKPILLLADHVFATPTAPAGPNTRIDIVEVRADRQLVDSETRRKFNETTGAFDPHAYYTTLSYKLDGLVETINAPANATQPLAYKVGVAANPGVAPATSPGYIKLAEINVGSAVATLNDSVIVDRRKLAGPGGVVRASLSFRLEWNGGAPIVTTLRANMPPGIRYGIDAEASKSAARIYIAGGEITHATAVAKVRGYTFVVGATQAYLPVELPILLSGDYVQTVDAALRTAALGSNPTLLVGVGTKLVAFEVQARYVADSGVGTTDVDQSNAALEDIVYDAVIDIAYH